MSTAANWDGILQRRYAALANPLPDVNTLAEFLPFVPKTMQGGDEYQHTIATQLEHGVTPDNTRTAFTYLGSKDSTTLPARLRGSTIVVTADIPTDMVMAGQNGGTIPGEHEDTLDLKVKQMLKGALFYREIHLAYGCGSASAAAANIGVVSVESGTDLGTGAGKVCDLTRASWSGGLWNNMLGAYVDVYESNGSTLVAAEVTVTAINKALNRITLFKSGSSADIDATDIIVPRGSRTKSAYGVQSLLTNTGSLLGIDAAAVPIWKSVSYSAAGALTRTKVLAMAGQVAENGVVSGGRLFVNPHTFHDLSEELADQQRFLDNKTAYRSGASKIVYQTAAGDFEVVNYMYQKQGQAFFLAKDAAIRIGASDTTTQTPGTQKWRFNQLEGSEGARLSTYANQAPLLEVPYHCAIITGLTNTGDTAPSA